MKTVSVILSGGSGMGLWSLSFLKRAANIIDWKFFWKKRVGKLIILACHFIKTPNTTYHNGTVT